MLEPLTATFAPASPERWDDVASVMQSCTYGRNCWCAYWYLSAAASKAGWGAANRAMLEGLVKSGAEPGLVAYVERVPAAWVGVAPRRT